MRTLFRWLLLAALAAGCGNAERPPGRVGGRYGGVFNMNETGPLRDIFPLSLTQVSTYRIMSQVYQGLVTFDSRDLSIRPCLAERWKVDADGLRYTFHLRKGVRFHDDPAFPEGRGRELVAQDVVHCFTAICSHGIGDKVMWLFQDRVEGANVHYAATAKGVPTEAIKGITALDDHTVRITLVRPMANFLQVMAHPACWIWPPELVTAYGPSPTDKAIGTGPFVMHTLHPPDAMVLERNPSYWERSPEGHPLPYLDAVRVTFVDDKDAEVDAFLRGRLSALLELPQGRMTEVNDTLGPDGRAQHHVLRLPALNTQFYGFDLFRPPFNDERVRRAFALAIDRRYLVDSVLDGLAAEAQHGIVPPGLAGYPYQHVPGYGYNPDSAQRLLAAAGYPGGRGFPSVQLQANPDGYGYVQVAGAVQEMLARVLKIPITLSVVRADEHYDRVERGRAQFWRDSWTADHPDPENFLSLLYGRNAVADTTLPAYLNSTRFRDAGFDRCFATAQRTLEPEERLRLLSRADSISMMRLPLLPLYHELAAYVVQSTVHGLQLNAIGYLDLSAVWLERKPKAAAAQ